MKNNLTFAGCWGLIVTFVTSVILLALVNAYTIQQLWGMFVVTVFHVPGLPLAGAYGLTLLASRFTNTPTSVNTPTTQTTKANENTWLGILLSAFFSVLLTDGVILLIGHLAYNLMVAR